MDQMPTPIVSYVAGGQRTVIRHILDMASTSTASTMRVECIIFITDAQTGSVKLITSIKGIVKYLGHLGLLLKAFSVDMKHQTVLHTR